MNTSPGSSTHTIRHRAAICPFVNCNGETVYTISKSRLWLPGVYDSEETARLALRFCTCNLALAFENYGYRVLSYEDLILFKQSRGFECDKHLISRVTSIR